MRAIYIILMGLPCWARLSRWIPLRVALPNSWWWINFTDLGLSVSCSRGRPSAKFPWCGSAIGQIPLVLVESYKVSAKSSKVSASRPLGLSAFRPSLLRSRPLGLSAKSSKVSASRPSLLRSRPLGRLSASRPSLLMFQLSSPGLSHVDSASGSQVDLGLAHTCTD